MKIGQKMVGARGTGSLCCEIRNLYLRNLSKDNTSRHVDMKGGNPITRQRMTGN